MTVQLNSPQLRRNPLHFWAVFENVLLSVDKSDCVLLNEM